MSRPGKLEERVTLRRMVNTPDGMGGYTQVQDDYATVWAQPMALSGDEAAEFAGVSAESQFDFTIRWRSDVLESDRIVWRGVEYNIRHIDRSSPRRMYLKIKAERGVGQ